MTEPNPTTEKSKKINAINKQTIHKICSGQVSKINISVIVLVSFCFRIFTLQVFKLIYLILN